MLVGFVPAFEAHELLRDKPPGTYLIRYSKTHPGWFAVTFVYKRNKVRSHLNLFRVVPPIHLTTRHLSTSQVKHCLLRSVPPAGVTLMNPPQVYPSLIDFAQAHSSKLVHPLGSTTSLASPVGDLDSQGWIFSMTMHWWLPFLNHFTPTTDHKTESSRAQGAWSDLGAKSEGDPDICTVCMDRRIQTVFLECGHLACCKECSKRLSDCPICRLAISRVVFIYRA